jgi:hypothetical protein
MIINAEFSSVCSRCNAQIQVGSLVEWSRGVNVRHVACAAKPKSPLEAVVKASVEARERFPELAELVDAFLAELVDEFASEGLTAQADLLRKLANPCGDKEG